MRAALLLLAVTACGVDPDIEVPLADWHTPLTYGGLTTFGVAITLPERDLEDRPCPTLPARTIATLNGTAGVIDTGGLVETEFENHPFAYCSAPTITWPGLALPPSGSKIAISDGATTWTVDAKLFALTEKLVTCTSHPDGIVRDGEPVIFDISPHLGTLTHASIGGRTSEGYTVFDLSEGQGLQIVGHELHFTVHSTLAIDAYVTASLAPEITTCDGPSACQLATSVDGLIHLNVD